MKIKFLFLFCLPFLLSTTAANPTFVKDGDSSYAPLWVKQDTQRFFRARFKDGHSMRIISPFCQADIATVFEIKYENNNAKILRWLNGDQTGAHNFVRLFGRESNVRTPGIYQVKLYTF